MGNVQERIDSPKLAVIATKFQGKARERPRQAGVTMGRGCDGGSLTGQEAEKMSNVTTHPALWKGLHGAQAVQGTHP